jgi:hypothetical protein
MTIPLFPELAAADRRGEALPGDSALEGGLLGSASPLPTVPPLPAMEKTLWLACSTSPVFFLDRYGHLYDPPGRGWVRFRLWPAQVQALERLAAHRLAVVLKARQLGMSWLTVGFGLWQMIFRPAATVLLFSQRDDEAVHLLTFRLRGMYDRLPPPFRARAVVRDNAHEFFLSNGSVARAFPTTGGRSYTASLAIVDEADHTDDLDGLLNAVKPTIDAGGRLVLLSTVDKSRPESPLKRIYRAALAGENDYTPIFLPWHAHPGRTAAWYAEQERDIRARTGGLDDLHQEYPATALEALAPRALDKFFPAEWMNKIADFGLPIADCETPAEQAGATNPASALNQQSTIRNPQLDIPGLTVHVPPQPGHSYVIGADPAEGNPQSDESAAVVLDCANGEQVATLGLRCDPEMFAVHLDRLARLYDDSPLGAEIMVERNNHGHAVILALHQVGASLLRGPDREFGWATTGASKHQMFDQAAKDIREGGLRLHDETTVWQLTSIDGATLAAPRGQHDDRAMACVLALVALRTVGGPNRGKSFIIPAVDPLKEIDEGRW